MSRLVVVDDEPLVLDAIRRQLRPGQQGWDARFFRDPAEALAFMDEHPTDVVLTDLNMASMSGEAFLQGIQKRSPGTVRLLLTGDSRMRTSLPAVLLAHQSFSKPCDPLELRHAIERALRTRHLFGADRLGGLAGAPETLPSVPQVYAELTRTMNDPDAGLADVAEVIERDAAISAKLVQLVNSSMFAVAQRVDSVRDAVSYLGMNLVRMLVLSAEVHQRFDADSMPPGFSLHREQAHASLVANIARGMTEDRELADRFFLAGLLHDVGRLVLAAAGSEGAARSSAEGPSHSAVGAFLLTLWGIPLSVVDAVAHHHEPASAEPDRFGAVTAIHVADVLAHEVQADGGDASRALDEDHLRVLGVHGRLDDWRRLAADLVGGGEAEAA